MPLSSSVDCNLTSYLYARPQLARQRASAHLQHRRQRTSLAAVAEDRPKPQQLLVSFIRAVLLYNLTRCQESFRLVLACSGTYRA